MHRQLISLMNGRNVVHPGVVSVHRLPTMKPILFALTLSLAAQAAEPVTIKLWPEGAPEKMVSRLVPSRR